MIQSSRRPRTNPRRASDIKREMLEESMRELPNFFVTVLDDEQGLYSFYYSEEDDARDMVAALTREGIAEDRIALYSRHG